VSPGCSGKTKPEAKRGRAERKLLREGRREAQIWAKNFGRVGKTIPKRGTKPGP